MSKELSLPMRALGQSLPDLLKNIGSVVVVVALLVGGFWGSHFLEPTQLATEESLGIAVAEPDVTRVLTLSREKVASAGIHTATVAWIDWQRTKTVAARIDYDSTRHLSIQAPAECVVKSWLIKSGQRVYQGDALAVLSGTEIALARSEIKKSEADVRVKKINFDWSKETKDNLNLLLATLKRRPTVEEVVVQFDGKLLGEHREHLLNTYTKYILASKVAKRTKPLSEQGIVTGKMAEARFSERDVASTEFTAACEQSDFDSRHSLAKAEAELELAQQRLAVSKGRLGLLLGPQADVSADGVAGNFKILAPFDGRIEALVTSPASRLAQGDEILRLADTSTLWVTALIHQHDWGVLQIESSELVSVTFPAIPNERFDAKFCFIGPVVSPKTRAISMVAELKNRCGRFRPGMLAWVDLPLEAAYKALVVPTASLQRHESQAFIFIAEGENRFRRVDVTTGFETPEQVEIKQGLTTGQRVVDRGAFYLKSELLLEQDQE
jgi:RND family efflux transporter MFP subunit